MRSSHLQRAFDSDVQREAGVALIATQAPRRSSIWEVAARAGARSVDFSRHATALAVSRP
jgi:hypothetical protein